MKRVTTRRDFLVTTSVGASVFFAGCVTSSDGSSNDSGTTDTATETNDTSDEVTTVGTDREVDRDDKNAARKNEPPKLPENGAVVFVYDDGPITDYTQAFPAHQTFDAPATTGIISRLVGHKNRMDVKHLVELVDAGWEIASHTAEHTTVGTYELVEDAAPTDERVYPSEARHGLLTPKDVEVTDSDRSVRVTATGRGTDDTGQYVELAESLGKSFPANETVIRYPKDVMERTIAGSKQDLQAQGFEVETFLAPYDDFDSWSRRFVDDHYVGVANGTHGTRINDPTTYAPYRTNRDYFIEFTEPEAVRHDLDEIAERGALGVFGAHTYKADVTEDRIRTTLEWIEDRNIEVLTLRNAVEIYAGDTE